MKLNSKPIYEKTIFSQLQLAALNIIDCQVHFVRKGPQKLKSLKLFTIHPLSPKTQLCAMKPLKIASSSSSRWQNRKTRPSQFTKNGDMNERAKRPVSDGVRE